MFRFVKQSERVKLLAILAMGRSALASDPNNRMWSQARSQVSKLGGGKLYFTGRDFSFSYMFKTKFSGHNKIGGSQTIWGEALLLIAPVATGLCEGITSVRFQKMRTSIGVN